MHDHQFLHCLHAMEEVDNTSVKTVEDTNVPETKIKATAEQAPASNASNGSPYIRYIMFGTLIVFTVGVAYYVLRDPEAFRQNAIHTWSRLAHLSNESFVAVVQAIENKICLQELREASYHPERIPAMARGWVRLMAEERARGVPLFVIRNKTLSFLKFVKQVCDEGTMYDFQYCIWLCARHQGLNMDFGWYGNFLSVNLVLTI